MFSFGHRPETLQHVALATAADGSLTGINHFAVAKTSQFEDFTKNVVGWSGIRYGCKNVELGYHLSKFDIYLPFDVRAPGAASGSIALETAMDKRTYATGLDPLEFRLRNYSDFDRAQDLPYSSKALRKCYAEGAAKFGWDQAPGHARLHARRQAAAGLGHRRRRVGRFQNARHRPSQPRRHRPHP